jgi:hypothetical protein
MRRLPTQVMIATDDGDFGIVSGGKARAIARELAADSESPIYIRHPVTDRILVTVHPTTKKGMQRE